MQSYHTIHKNCLEAYKSLCAILPESLILDYETALTLPDRTQFSYAVPSKMKKICRNKTPQDVNGKRLFSRIMEYVVKAGSNLTEEEIFKLTSDFYDNYYNQRQFSKFFRFSILYRNFRNKVILETQANIVEWRVKMYIWYLPALADWSKDKSPGMSFPGDLSWWR